MSLKAQFRKFEFGKKLVILIHLFKFVLFCSGYVHFATTVIFYVFIMLWSYTLPRAYLRPYLYKMTKCGEFPITPLKSEDLLQLSDWTIERITISDEHNSFRRKFQESVYKRKLK